MKSEKHSRFRIARAYSQKNQVEKWAGLFLCGFEESEPIEMRAARAVADR
jgi:hypothetical protein